MRLWTLDSNNNNGNFFVREYALPSKTHAVGYDYPYLLIGSIEGKGLFLDISKLPNIDIPNDTKNLIDLMETGSKFQSI